MEQLRTHQIAKTNSRTYGNLMKFVVSCPWEVTLSSSTTIGKTLVTSTSSMSIGF